MIADEENYVVIQFDSEEEAQRCLEALRQNRFEHMKLEGALHRLSWEE